MTFITIELLQQAPRSLKAFLILYSIFCVWNIARLMTQKIDNTLRLCWLLNILFLPIFGVILYVIMGPKDETTDNAELKKENT